MGQVIPSDDELKFQLWYQKYAKKLKLDPDPDNPEHYYDYRAAYKANAEPDESGHWPSQFKLEGHPNLYINGIDTRTGMPQSSSGSEKKHEWEDLSPIDAPRTNDWADLDPAPPPEKQKSVAGKVWGALDKPLLHYIPGYQEERQRQDELVRKAAEPGLHTSPFEAQIKGFTTGGREGLLNALEAFTSPLNAALTLATGGEAAVARQVGNLSKVGKTVEAYNLGKKALVPLAAARQTAAAPVIIKGGQGVFDSRKSWDERALAGTELAGGLAAMFGGPWLKTPTEPIPKPTSAWRGELPPMPEGPRFLGGEHGVTERGRTYPTDTGQTPDIFSGTVLPREFGEVIDLPADTKANYGPAQGHPLAFKDPDMYTGQPIRTPQGEVRQSPYGQQLGQPGGPLRLPTGEYFKNLPEGPPEPPDIAALLGPDFVPVGEESAYNQAVSPERKPGEMSLADIAAAQEKYGTKPRPPVVDRPSKQAAIATFLGYQPDAQGGQVALYNIEGGANHGSTVTTEGLVKAGIDIPETPPFDPNNRLSGEEIRRRMLGDKQIGQPKQPFDISGPQDKLPDEGPPEPNQDDLLNMSDEELNNYTKQKIREMKDSYGHDTEEYHQAMDEFHREDYNSLVRDGYFTREEMPYEKFKEDSLNHEMTKYDWQQEMEHRNLLTSNQDESPVGAEEAPFITDKQIIRNHAKNAELHPGMTALGTNYSNWEDIFGHPDDMNNQMFLKDVANNAPQRLMARDDIFPYTELPPPSFDTGQPPARIPHPDDIAGARDIPPELGEMIRTPERGGFGAVKSPLERGMPSENPLFKQGNETFDDIEPISHMRVTKGGYGGDTTTVVNPKTGRPNIAMGGADERVLDIIGTSLYTKDRPSVVVKELLQNVVDEMHIAGIDKPIRIVFDERVNNPKSLALQKSITFRDFGRGMDGNSLYTNFSDVGKSGKGDVEGAAGGFGFAKAAPFLSGEYLKVESITWENGERVKYTFEGSPAELKNQKVGVPLKRVAMGIQDPDASTGMQVEVFYLANKSFYTAKRLLKSTVENSQNIGNIHVLEDFDTIKTNKNNFLDKGTEPYDNAIETLKSKGLPTKRASLNTPDNDMDIHYDMDDKERKSSKLSILNNGIFVFEDYLHSGIRRELPYIPERVVVNIKTKVQEGKEGYPFPANREGLSDHVKQQIDEWYKQEIGNAALQREKDETQDLYSKLQPEGHELHVVHDSGGKYTPEELAKVKNSPELSSVAQEMAEMLAGLDNMFGGDALARTEKFGFIVSDNNHGGINIRNPSDSNKTAIMVNVLGTMSTAQNPMDAAQGIAHTIFHEYVHNHAREEGAGYTWKFYKLSAEYPFESLVGTKNAIYRDITTPYGQYTPALQEILQEYTNARRREESTPDILSRQSEGSYLEGQNREPENALSNQPNGTGITGSSGLNQQQFGGPKQPLAIQQEPYNIPGEGNDRKVPKPPRQRKDPTQAIGNLQRAIEISSKLRESQEAMYSEERGNRMREASKITTPGMEGFNQQKAKLAGELPKETPGAHLSQEDVDTLIDAVTDSTRIGWWQKLNAKQGLVKILGGDEVPQRSELQLLTRVFGDDVGQFLEMHAGLPIPFGEARRLVKDYAGLMKSYMSSLDLSAPFRQGIGLVHKSPFWKNIGPMVHMAFSPEFYDTTMQSIAERPLFSLLHEAGLKLPGVDPLSSREEAFPSNLAQTGSFLPEAIRPAYQQTLGKIASASDRAYTGFLVKTRADVADALVRNAGGARLITQNTDGSPTKLTQDIAKFVNNASGRGDLGRAEKYADDLNAVFFSPRMIASRFQTFNPKYYTNLDPFVRKEAIKSALAIAGFGLMVTHLMKWAGGAETKYNPLSSDFLKAKWGRARLDPFGGYQQFVVFFARFLAGRTESDAYGLTAPTRWSITENFGANKLSPVGSLVHSIATSKPVKGTVDPDSPFGSFSAERVDRFGKPMNLSWELTRRFIPMFMSDIQAVLDENPDLAPILPLAGLGMGTQVFEDQQERSPFRLNVNPPSLGR